MKVKPNGLEVIVAVIISFFILNFLSHYLQLGGYPIPKNQYKTIFISGTDTIVVPDLSIVDLTKCKATDFGKDTINHFYYYRFGKKEVDSERYFFISYKAYEKGSSGSIDGENWFTTTGGFPPKRMIEDSVIMPYLRSVTIYSIWHVYPQTLQIVLNKSFIHIIFNINHHIFKSFFI